MNKKFGSLTIAAALCVMAPTLALAQGTVVYDGIPSPVPPNVVSLGFQCCATSEFGDEIKLDPFTPRRTGYATVVMSNWAKHSEYPTMAAVGYTQPITLNLYVDAATAAAHTPVKTVTQSFVIPWRSEADLTCPGGTAWRAADNGCYNGFAFEITFDLRALNYDLPEQFIFGIAFNTNTWGYAPLHAAGPYESLNVGLNSTPPVAVGTDVNTDAVYWNTAFAGFYADGGAGGVGSFRLDSAWAPYTPAIQFRTFAVPVTSSDCKNGAWQNLVRADFTPFRNQGACVSYGQTGR